MNSLSRHHSFTMHYSFLGRSHFRTISLLLYMHTFSVMLMHHYCSLRNFGLELFPGWLWSLQVCNCLGKVLPVGKG
ncbi:unnamed protein product [Linum tenue]|uniref:Uncharacterized protein n=1 Tax=Linum tenue TaxID=586396 RepID=A0AAV0JN33_9ROSI|nr:unnamed protein product [Linum tenue]